jgi:hypothetical protein
LGRKFNIAAKEIITNDRFAANKQGLGFGVSVLNNQINHASKLGFEQLQTQAVRNNNTGQIGYYVWLMMGYIPVKDSGFEYYLKEAVSRTKFEGIDSYLELLSTQEGRDLWRERGDDFDGVFDLAEDSLSRQIFNKYLETRKISKAEEEHKDPFAYYFTEEELNNIFSSLNNENLVSAYARIQEHEDWRDNRKEEIIKSLGAMHLDENEYERDKWFDLCREFKEFVKTDPSHGGKLVKRVGA